MTGGKRIPANEFCTYHEIELSFINELQEYGLLNIPSEEGEGFITEDQLEEIEKMIRLHYDLHINLEGIDAIRHLLNQMKRMQTEMSMLKNKLRLYEG